MTITTDAPLTTNSQGNVLVETLDKVNPLTPPKGEPVRVVGGSYKGQVGTVSDGNRHWNCEKGWVAVELVTGIRVGIQARDLRLLREAHKDALVLIADGPAGYADRVGIITHVYNRGIAYDVEMIDDPDAGSVAFAPHEVRLLGTTTLVFEDVKVGDIVRLVYPMVSRRHVKHYGKEFEVVAKDCNLLDVRRIDTWEKFEMLSPSRFEFVRSGQASEAHGLGVGDAIPAGQEGVNALMDLPWLSVIGNAHGSTLQRFSVRGDRQWRWWDGSFASTEELASDLSRVRNEWRVVYLGVGTKRD